MATVAKAASKKVAVKKAAVKKTAAKKLVAKKAVRSEAIILPPAGQHIQLGHALTSARTPLTIPSYRLNAVPGNGVIIGPVPGRIPADQRQYRAVYSISLHGGEVIADVAIRFRPGR